MINMILNQKAKSVKGVNATLYVKVKWFKFNITFGRGNPGRPDVLEFDSFKELMRGKPSRSSGTGAGIIAFKEMIGG